MKMTGFDPMEVKMNKKINSMRFFAGITAITMLTTGVVGGCSKTEETSSEETTTSEVTEETNEEPTEETTAEVTTAETTEETTAEETTTEPPEYRFEGQEEYMRPATRGSGTNLHFIYDDLNEIEDEDAREHAQEYADRGYTIYDPLGVDRYGDNEFEFTTGFGGECIDDRGWVHVTVWKMDETLFEYYIVDRAVWWDDDEGEIEDDGTVITYSLYVPSSGYSASYEYNRDTGFMTFCEIEPREEYWPLIVDDIEDPNLYSYALECIDNGFVLYPATSYSMAAQMGRVNLVDQFWYNDGMTYVECSIMSRDVFDEISSYDYAYAGGGHEDVTEGHITTITYYNADGTLASRYQYDGDTHICQVESFM